MHRGNAGRLKYLASVWIGGVWLELHNQEKEVFPLPPNGSEK